MNQVFGNEVWLRQSGSWQGCISRARDECGRESCALSSDCVPYVSGNHAARGRLDIELLRNHVIHPLRRFIRAYGFNAELTLEISGKTGLLEWTLAAGIRWRVCQSHHAIPQLLKCFNPSTTSECAGMVIIAVLISSWSSGRMLTPLIEPIIWSSPCPRE